MAAGFSVVISATDKASGTFAAVNKSLAKTWAPVNKLGHEVKKFGDVSGLNRLGSGLESLARRGVQVATSVAAIAPALGGITGAASIAGLAALTSKFAAMGQQLGFNSQRIGISVERLADLQGAARLAGGSAEDMTAGLRGLQQTLTDAAGGRNTEAVVLFNKLGISFRDANGHARGVNDTLPELADKIAAIHDPQIQAMVATQLFGSAAEGLLPLLRQGSRGIRDNADEARRLAGITGEGAEASRKFQAAQARVQLAVEGLGFAVASKLMPVLTPMLDKLAEFIASHSGEVSAFFERVAAAIGAWIENGGIQRTIDGLTAFIEKVQAVVTALGGWQSVAEGLLVFMTGKFALGMVGSLAKVAGAVATTGQGIAGIASRAIGALGGEGAVATAGLGVAAAALAYGTYKGATMTPEETKAAQAKLEDLHKSQRRGAQLEVNDGFGPDGMPLPAADRGDDQPRAGLDMNGARDLGRAIADALAQKAQENGDLGGLPGTGPASGTAFGGAAGGYGMATPGERRGAGLMLGASTPKPTTPEQDARAREAHDFFKARGWSDEQAAGIVASLHKESSFNTGAVGDGGAAYGIAQWHGDRRAAIQAGTGKSVVGASFQDQLAAVDYELKNNEKAAGNALRGAKTASEAGAIVSKLYERPADREGEAASRGASAQRFLRSWEQPPAAAAAGAPVSIPQAAGPAANVAQPAGGAAGANGSVDVTLTHRNPPPGTTATVQTSGNVDANRVKVERSTDALMYMQP